MEGAWWAIVHGVAKSRTRLSDFTSLTKTLLLTIYKVLLSLAWELEESLLEAAGISPRLQDKAEQSEQRADRLRDVVGGRGLPLFGSPLSASPLANSSLELLWANHQGRDLIGPWPFNLFNQLRPQVQNLLTQAWRMRQKMWILGKSGVSLAEMLHGIIWTLVFQRRERCLEKVKPCQEAHM